jgi:hypothetical protein
MGDSGQSDGYWLGTAFLMRIMTLTRFIHLEFRPRPDFLQAGIS